MKYMLLLESPNDMGGNNFTSYGHVLGCRYEM